MENQDIKPQVSNSNPQPKPTDDAQSLVETIIPSTEEKASSTTKVEQASSKSESPITKKKEDDGEQTDANSEETNIETTDEACKDQHDEGDKIETVAP